MATQTRDLKWVEHLDGTWLQCRTLRHSWQVDTFKALTPEDWKNLKRKPSWVGQVIRRTLWCTRCQTMRIELFGRSNAGTNRGARFEKFRSSYVYPKGYTFRRVDHEYDRPANNDYTWEQYRRYGQL